MLQGSTMYSKIIDFLKSTLTRISPELNTRILYFIKYKRPIRLKSPVTLDEKIQWLKLNTYLNNPLITQCADKLRVRDFVTESGCAEILNELYGTYDAPEEISWKDLPYSFVLKWNFGCGHNIVCLNKSEMSFNDVKAKLSRWGRIKMHLAYSEMQYKDIEKKIICERYIKPEAGILPEDYKIYCFNGVPKYILFCTGREFGAPKYYFFDRNWELARINKDSQDARQGFTLKKPEGIDRMFDYAEKLSRKFPFVRADFYLINGAVIFGELTFTPSGGFDTSRLKETNQYFGSLVTLPN